MKKNLWAMLLAGVLAVSMLLGAMAVAESLPAEAPASEPAEAPAEAADANQASALEDAYAAYRAALASNRLEAYAQELAEMVANAQLTQAQADLLLSAAKQRMEERENGCGRVDCPNADGGYGRNNRGMCGNQGCGMCGNQGCACMGKGMPMGGKGKR